MYTLDEKIKFDYFFGRSISRTTKLRPSVKRPVGFWALLCLPAGAKGPEAGKRLPLPEGMALTCRRAARRADAF